LRLSSEPVRRILIGVLAFVATLAVIIVILVIATEQGASARRSNFDTASALASTNPTASVEATVSQVATGVVSAGGAPLEAYQGLGAWIDLYDTPAWRDPTTAVRDMSHRGVRTVFVQTGSYLNPAQVIKPDKLRQFITLAHKHGMKVVGWYMPDMKLKSVDYIRVMRAIRLKTADGQTFDSFGLDIESNKVSSEALRNRGLKVLSQKVRASVGATYPLGAIIPAPASISKPNSMWENFPYTMLAGIYDVFVPMGYYTFDGTGGSIAYSDVRANIRIIRKQRGCSQIPIHLIGGIAEESADVQTAGFVKGVLEGHILGASLYSYPGTSRGAWRMLRAIKP
jgi:hypothetical protein